MNSTRILVVEDDVNLGQILEEYLKLKGFTTTLATDGEAGLTAFYGESKSDQHVQALLQRAVALGCAPLMVDTAEVYRTATLFNETVVGGAIRAIGRDKFIIATKHYPFDRYIASIRSGEATLRDVIRKACTNSLERLGVDVIDLYYLHRCKHVTNYWIWIISQYKNKYIYA